MNSVTDSNGCNRIAGRVALICGGAHGIGRAIASAFQREGARVFILDCEARGFLESGRIFHHCTASPLFL
jgi:NAD(P)-dependent dehydrogenase (short-subunit alcohol dehydrogenase family)